MKGGHGKSFLSQRHGDTVKTVKSSSVFSVPLCLRETFFFLPPID